MLVSLIPWVALYELTAHLGLHGRSFQFAFEDRLPVFSWTAIVYQSIYPAVALAPWFARTRRDLRRLTVSTWLAMAVVFPFYWVMPSTAPRRSLEVTNPVAGLLSWERNTFPPTAAFPSFHVLWVIFIARVYRPRWLAALYAAAVTVSCVTTGMHYIPDLLASLVIAPLLTAPEMVWKLMQRAFVARVPVSSSPRQKGPRRTIGRPVD